MTNLAKDPIRLRSVTATEMSSLLGLNKYSTPRKILENKTNPQEVMNVHVRRGKLMEPAVLEAFDLDLKMKTQRHVGPTIELKEFKIAATPDAYVLGTKDVVEAKSISSYGFEGWHDMVPLNYHIQVMVQMLVVGSDKGYIGALEAADPKTSEFRFIAWELQRNEEIEDIMKAEAQRFWELVEKKELFRVDSKIKKRVLELLPSLSTRIYPTETILHEYRKRKDREREKVSDLLAIFKQPWNPDTKS